MVSSSTDWPAPAGRRCSYGCTDISTALPSKSRPFPEQPVRPEWRWPRSCRHGHRVVRYPARHPCVPGSSGGVAIAVPVPHQVMFACGIGLRNHPASSSGGTLLSLCGHRWNIAVVIPDRAIRAKRHIAVVGHPEADRSGGAPIRVESDRSGASPAGQVRSGQVRSGQVRSGQVSRAYVT